MDVIFFPRKQRKPVNPRNLFLIKIHRPSASILAIEKGLTGHRYELQASDEYEDKTETNW